MKSETDSGPIFFSSDQVLARYEHGPETTIALLFYFATEADGWADPSHMVWFPHCSQQGWACGSG